MTKIYDSLYDKKKTPIGIIVLNAIIVLLVLIFTFEIIFTIKYSGIYVVESSMYPTLNGAPDLDTEGGDFIYIDKKATVSYGDIVVTKNNAGTTIIKRVIALGGDTVKITRGTVYVKYRGETEFKELVEDYIGYDCNDPNKPQNTFPRGEKYFYGGIVLDDGVRIYENYMFLLGDNRNISLDSRDGGAVPVKNLYGVVPGWSLKLKSLSTKAHDFFTFKLPAAFGLK